MTSPGHSNLLMGKQSLFPFEAPHILGSVKRARYSRGPNQPSRRPRSGARTLTVSGVPRASSSRSVPSSASSARLVDTLRVRNTRCFGKCTTLLETVSRWLNAPVFPKRRIRSDRRRDQASLLQSRERGLQPSLTRTHYSAGRVSPLLNMPPPTLLPAQKRHLEAFFRFCPKSHRLRRFILQFRAMMRWRSAKKLGAWIKAASTSGFHFLAQSPTCSAAI
jgi:hypothetical protein